MRASSPGCAAACSESVECLGPHCLHHLYSHPLAGSRAYAPMARAARSHGSHLCLLLTDLVRQSDEVGG
jgi:hypothetical protein